MTTQTSTVSSSFEEMGIRIRKERDEYRTNSVLWNLRNRARSLKTTKAKRKAWDVFTVALQAKFPEGSTVWVDEGVHFDTFYGGSFATYKPIQVVIHWNNGHTIHFDLSSYNIVEIYYDPCGHDNLMALELAQLNNNSKD